MERVWRVRFLGGESIGIFLTEIYLSVSLTEMVLELARSQNRGRMPERLRSAWKIPGSRGEYSPVRDDVRPVSSFRKNARPSRKSTRCFSLRVPALPGIRECFVTCKRPSPSVRTISGSFRKFRRLAHRMSIFRVAKPIRVSRIWSSIEHLFSLPCFPCLVAFFVFVAFSGFVSVFFVGVCFRVFSRSTRMRSRRGFRNVRRSTI